ncbi:MAG: 50S ribosomal protein L6 [Methanoregulaceae archaeon]|jgi:large subunit ribosomal protein L6|nr:50S ribosomal protein L6 [Methanoregulaceae archaeon]
MAVVRKVSIPEGVKVELEGTLLKVKGPKGQLERSVRFPQITTVLEDNTVIFSTDSDRKSVIAMVGTFAAHTNNMCRGVTTGFEYRMKVVYSHFPIQLKLQGNKLEINNFLGEKKARYATIVNGVTAKIGNDEIVLSGIDKELLGNTSANIEHATKIRNRDPRIFQDGIYIVERA